MPKSATDQRRCVCGKSIHPGTVMRSQVPGSGPRTVALSDIDEGTPYDAIVVRVSPVPPPPMRQVLDLVALTQLHYQHRGDLLTWQADVGEPVQCANMREVPPPCSSSAPACQDARQYRLSWERTAARA